jgi:hypothetical protein
MGQRQRAKIAGLLRHEAGRDRAAFGEITGAIREGIGVALPGY